MSKQHLSISAISQLLLTRYWPNFFDPILVGLNFCTPHFFGPNFFRPKYFLDWILFFTIQPNFFFDEIVFGPTKIFRFKFLEAKCIWSYILCPKFFRLNFFWPSFLDLIIFNPNSFGKTIFLTQNFFDSNFFHLQFFWHFLGSIKFGVNKLTPNCFALNFESQKNTSIK